MPSVKIRNVSSKKDLRNFIKLPWQIYKNDKCWVPPLIIERKEILNTKKNPFYQHAEIQLFLAMKDGKTVGRIAALTNENHNKFQNDNAGFFGFYESIHDQDVTDTLCNAAVNWLRSKGKDQCIGPFNPSTNDDAAILIDGFDTPPYVMMTHNPPYYQNLLENFGFEKAKDLYAWYLETDNLKINEKLNRVAGITEKKFNISIRNIKLKNLDKEKNFLRQVYNDAWSHNWGFVPMTDEEFTHLADALKLIADEELVLVAEKDNQPVGFSLTLPNINEVLIRNKNGRLFPLGVFRILFGMKKIKTIRVITLGIIEKYQFAGLGSVLVLETIKRATNKGYIAGEMSWILEDNHTMNRELALLNADVYKTYRVYKKDI